MPSLTPLRVTIHSTTDRRGKDSVAVQQRVAIDHWIIGTMRASKPSLVLDKTPEKHSKEEGNFPFSNFENRPGDLAEEAKR
ncbi:MAG: hypothetical protein WCI02_18750 [Planctomycetota bacterium]